MTKDKKELTNRWLKAFPALRPYTNSKLYKILGPFIIGIELIKLPWVDEYRPHFVLYPLYRKNLKSCLDYPELLFEFYNHKNLQYSIPYDDNILTNEVIEIIRKKEQLPFSLDGKVHITTLYKLIDSWIIDSLTRKQLKQPEYLELKFHLSLFISNKEAGIILEQIQNASKGWDMNRFTTYYGEFDVWLDNLKKVNRKTFLSVIEKNISDKKLKKLQQDELS